MEELLRNLLVKASLPGNQYASYATDDEIDKPVAAKCECGYDPSDKSHDAYKYERCYSGLALRNHISFPSLDFISNYDEPSTLYHNYGDVIFPSRHWATYIEIKRDMSPMRPGVIGFNQYGDKVQVHFYHDNGAKPTTFTWDNLKTGYTMAILYPEKKQFMFGGTQGIRLEELDRCFIFKASLETVQKEAQKLLSDADMAAEGALELECFGCATKKASLSYCGACKLAKYCSKVNYITIY